MTVADDSLEAVMAERLTRAARAAQDLCDVLWEALHEELSDRSLNGPRAQRVADLSERVAGVSATVMALVCYARPEGALHEASPAVEPSAPPEPAAAPAPSAAAEATVTPRPSAVAAPRSKAVIVDERAEEPELISAVEQAGGDPPTRSMPARDQTPAAGEQPSRGRPLPWDEPPREEMRVTRRATDRPPADRPA
jgi:hypothetical protein